VCDCDRVNRDDTQVQRRATYRVQLRAEFDFAAVAAVAGYLADLGVSHVYCSPYTQAAAGSSHGYDVVDPTRISEELGGAAGHAAMCAALRRHHLSQLLDIVPNHMYISDRGNRWWWDVLRAGRQSPYACWVRLVLGLGQESRLHSIAKPGRRPMAFAAAAVTPEKRRQENAVPPWPWKIFSLDSEILMRVRPAYPAKHSRIE